MNTALSVPSLWESAYRSLCFASGPRLYTFGVSFVFPVLAPLLECNTFCSYLANCTWHLSSYVPQSPGVKSV